MLQLMGRTKHLALSNCGLIAFLGHIGYPCQKSKDPRQDGQRRWKLKGSVSLMITTGKQIRAARAALNWTQGDLAERSRLHFKAVAYWERRDTITPRQCGSNSGPVKMLAAFQSAGIDLVSSPQLGVLFER